MKKVLFCTPSLSRANGISKFIMSYYNYLIKNKIQIDFFIVENSIDDLYKDKIESNGGKIFVNKCSSKIKRIKQTKNNITEVLATYNYDIVHVNLVDLYACGCIIGAKKMNVKNIIYHAHNPLNITKLLFIRNLLNYICIKNSTKCVACSSYAGDSVFGNHDYSIITNALDFNEYKFCKKYRVELRKELNIIDDDFVVGVVGRICNQKNYRLVFKVFKELVQLKNNCKLVWVGDGDKYNALVKLISKYKLNNNIILTGSRSDVYKFYSLFDCFLLPSKYEGLGIVLLESQASGLHTITSTNVPVETRQSDLIDYIKINKSIKTWVNAILNIKRIDRKEYNSLLQKSTFSIKYNIDKIIDIYGGDE